jgi:hypothetical protein
LGSDVGAGGLPSEAEPAATDSVLEVVGVIGVGPSRKLLRSRGLQ